MTDNKKKWGLLDYSEQYLADIILLTKDNYGEIEIANKDYLLWQYVCNPHGQAVISLAKSSLDDKVVGQYIVIPMSVIANGQEVLGSVSLNTLTHSDFRGQGIFTVLAKDAYKKCAERGIDFTYGFPNQNSYPGFVKKLGFEDIGHVPLLIKPLKIKELVKKKIRNTITKNIMIGLGACLSPLFKIKQSNFNDIEVVKIHRFDNSYSQFWSEVKGKYNVMVDRSTKFMNWRYFDIPLRKYQVFVAKNKGNVMGYIITRIQEVEGINNGMIVDFLVADNDIGKRSGLSLISYALKEMNNLDIEMMGCLMLPHTHEFNLLRKSGFLICPKFLEPQPFPVIFKEHISIASKFKLDDLSKWFYTMGDYDAI